MFFIFLPTGFFVAFYIGTFLFVAMVPYLYTCFRQFAVEHSFYCIVLSMVVFIFIFKLFT